MQAADMDTAIARVSSLFYSCDEAFKANPDLTEDKIKELKSWASERDNLFPGLTDQQYVLFLHSVYGDVDKAKDCMESLYEHAIDTPQFFDHWDTSRDHINLGLEVAYYSPLPKLSPRNHLVIVAKYRDLDASKYEFADGVRLISMTMEAQLLNRGPQEGICVILDMTGMTFAHLWRFSIPLVRRFIEILQESLPVRLKEIHITNCSYVLPPLMSLIKPFMKKELADMIQCHSGAMKTFHEQFPKEYLPKELGGFQGDLLTHHNNNIQLMTKMAPMWRARDAWLAKVRTDRNM